MENINYISEIRESASYQDVNDSLKNGWVLLGVEGYKTDDGDCGFLYSLGKPLIN